MQPQNSCDDCVRIDATVIGGNCSSARGNINNCLDGNIESVEWSWELAGECGTSACPLGAITANDDPLFRSPVVDLSQISLPPQPVGYFIVFHATINYIDDTPPCEDVHSFLLTCWNTNGGGIGNLKNVSLYPNPTSKGSSVSFDGLEFNKIATVEIFDASGNTRINTSLTSNSIDTSSLTTGIYFVKFTMNTGETIQKKLIIK